MKSEAEELDLRALLKHTPDSIYYTDEEGRFDHVSDTKAGRSGVPWQEMIGKKDFDFLPPDVAQRCRDDDLFVMRTGESIVNKEEELIRLDGTRSWVSTSKFPRMDGDRIIGVIGISRDITERKKMEKHILRMLAIATHDMRSPIVSIAAELTRIAKGRLGMVDDSAKAALFNVLDKMILLEGIVTNYLGKASLMNSDGIGKKENLDLRQDIIDPILEELSADIEARGIQVDNQLGGIPEDKILVSANKLWLGIVYRNLFSNAIKHTPDGGVIAYGFEDNGDVYRLNVFNNGKSILPEKKESIFEMFESGDDSSGIGLPMIRELIQRHGGDLWCEDTWSGHPNFVFTLPKE